MTDQLDIFAAIEEACTVPEAPARRTTRERREARAERLRDWADGQERKGTARVEAARAVADMIPLGQPMMPGHHSYRADVNRRARMRSNWDKGFEALNKAESMRSRAANIEAAAARAIYSDDDDAVPALEARIAALEAERAAVKAYNVSCRKGAPCPDLLLPQQRAKLEQVQRYSPCPRDDGSLPGYVLSNLSGNIKRNRDRLAQLRRGAS
jgi:hypothetical protein